ncbi:hypothetical protein [Pseudomonas sp. NPDC086251]|uniref:hypothetical protein n=1 Tax=Pseudomonas sp. NPDC086251 TaxID=3364431 RepID=UPI0038379583
MQTLTASPPLKNIRAFPLPQAPSRNMSLRRGGGRPYEERAEYWLEYFQQLQQGPPVLLKMSLDGLLEHEVKARYIRNDETMRHALERQVRKLTAMQRALGSLAGDELAPFRNDVLRQLMQIVTDSTLMELRND